GGPDRLHPRVVRRADARSALVRAVPRAAEDRRRLHGRPRNAGARPRAPSGHAREVRRQARLIVRQLAPSFTTPMTTPGDLLRGCAPARRSARGTAAE